MEKYNIYGWSALHEACYKGYTNAITRFLDYARETGKNLIEQKTIDDYETTPIMIAALGGHLEVVDLLVKNGANFNAQLKFQESSHGIIEVACIRQNVDMLVYMYDLIPDIATRIKNLLTCTKFDNETRASIGRTVETLSRGYSIVIKKLSKFKAETHESRLVYLFEKDKLISYRLFNLADFGSSLATFLRLNETNEDAITSCMLTLVNVAENDAIRSQFLSSHGLKYMISFIDNHKKNLTSTLCHCLDILRRQNKQTFMENSFDDFEESREKFELNCEPKSSWLDYASIGQALDTLCKHEDCLIFVNKNAFNQIIIDYIKILFDYTNFCRYVELMNGEETIYSELAEIVNKGENGLIFEQFIGAYLSCLGNLTHFSKTNKKIILSSNLFELMLNFWNQVSLLTRKSSNRKNEIYKLNYFSSDSSLLSFNEYSDQSSGSHYQNADTQSILHSILSNEGTNSSKMNYINKVIDMITPVLVKNLKMTIIECIGKVFYHNDDLKKKYIFPSDVYYFTKANYTQKEEINIWVLSTVRFIKFLISYLDAITFIDREYQLQVLGFIRYLTDDDQVMQNRLIHIDSAFSSALVNNFRNFLRKSSHISIRTSALLCLWSLTGEKNYQDCFDRKSTIYRAVGAQKFVDTLFDSNEQLILICLEALTCISNSPPYREADSNRLVYTQDDLAQVHAASALVRILKTQNSSVLFACLRTISAMCVSIGYHCSIRNQSQLEKLGAINQIVDVLFRKSTTNRLKSEAFSSLAALCFTNSNNRKSLRAFLGAKMEKFVQELISLLIEGVSMEVENLAQKIEVLDTQITCGLAICTFSYKNDDFIRKIIMDNGRIRWHVFAQILQNLEECLEKSYLRNKELFFECQRLKCLYGFFVTALHNLITDADQDPRAIGMQILANTVPQSDNTYLRSIACDFIGRLASYNDCLIESLLSIDVIEILVCSLIENQELNEINLVGNTEKGCAAITIGFFTSLKAEARRVLLRLAREHPQIVDVLAFFNEQLHIDLVMQWNHFKEMDQAAKKEIKFHTDKTRRAKI
ncbi:ankyrin and armadillo repeat-containing -like [Brachionus plicatilis]|uniref:Ankyrin and armadillo repeat-containing-like n=1 Tax=Brachionus plicatilis TaxID=10195 RepID=A0A3M7P6B4_BRAPC|nr:ankyrin and armadillo repeat-containing -like [Brachionus plicatilis]